MKQSIGKALLLLLILSYAKGVNVYQCDSVTTELRITNNYNTIQHYTVQKSGAPASWTIVSPMSFLLVPGQSRVLTAFTEVDCDERPGNYNLTIKAVSEDDVVINNTLIKVIPAHYVEVDNPEVINSCVNEELIIPFKVINQGKYDELINLTSTNGRLSVNSLHLSSDDFQNINLYFKPTEVGLNNVKVLFDYENNHGLTDLSVIAAECSNFKARLTNSYINLCENEEQVIKLIITNEGEAKNFYFNASSYYFDLPSMIKLNTNETMDIPVTIYTGCTAGVKSLNISVWADGARKINLPLIINSKECYKPIISSSVKSSVACSCENISYEYTVYNPGIKTMTYALTASNGEVIPELTLGAGESANVTINYTIPCSFSGKLDLTLNATAISTCAKTASDKVLVAVNKWSDCEAVKVLSPTIVPINNTQLTVPVTIKNVGIRPASYNIIVSGSLMNNLLGLSDGFLTLEPGESRIIELTVNPVNLTAGYLTVNAYSVDNAASSSSRIIFGKLPVINNYYLAVLATISSLTLLVIRKKNQSVKK